MLGHDVEVLVNDDPDKRYSGTLHQKDETGVIIYPYGYIWDSHPMFIPMHRISEIIDKGYRGSF